MLRVAYSYSNNIIVNEYPKSGGTWLSQLISEIVGVPFPRNTYPQYERCILHGHYKSNFMRKNIITLWRDGKDISVSFYYHCLIPNGIGNQALIIHVSRHLNFHDPDDIQNNLPDFLEFMFSNKSLYWAVLYVLSSVARKFGYTQKAHRRIGRRRTISGW